MSTDDPIVLCETRLYEAQLSSDAAALDELLDDELVFIGLDGNRVGKADDLAMHRSGQFRITRMQIVQRSIQRFGDTAVVFTRMDTQAQIGESIQDAVIQYTRVWHLAASQWRVVAGHMSIVQNQT